MVGPTKETKKSGKLPINRPLFVVYAEVVGDGRPMKPLVIQALGAKLAGKSQAEIRRLIDEYFAKIVWSLEKEEWEKMSEGQRALFVRRAREKAKSCPR